MDLVLTDDRKATSARTIEIQKRLDAQQLASMRRS